MFLLTMRQNQVIKCFPSGKATLTPVKASIQSEERVLLFRHGLEDNNRGEDLSLFTPKERCWSVGSSCAEDTAPKIRIIP